MVYKHEAYYFTLFDSPTYVRKFTVYSNIAEQFLINNKLEEALTYLMLH